jgi:hypothetical protein
MLFLPKELHAFFYGYIYSNKLNAYDMIVSLIYKWSTEHGFKHECRYKIVVKNVTKGKYVVAHEYSVCVVCGAEKK